MKVFLHAGFHKTATTSIQRLLRANAHLAPEGYGFYTRRNCPVLDTLNPWLRAHHQLPCKVTRAQLRSRLAGLRAWIAAQGCEVAVISYENLLGPLPDQRAHTGVYRSGNAHLKLIAEAFRDDDPEFFFSTRDTDSWIRSLHGHRLRSRGMRMSHKDFAALPKFRNLDWNRLVAELTEGLSARHSSGPLEQDLAMRLGPGSAFIAQIDPEGDWSGKWSPVAKLNTGLGERAMAFAAQPWTRWLPGYVRGRMITLLDNRIREQG